MRGIDSRSYVLRLNADGCHPSPSLVCRGPENVLSVLNGRRVEDGVKLAGLLFPICPRAHQSAALRAAEAAMGININPGQAAARQAIVLAEAIAACVWRSALDWPRLMGEPGLPEPVRRARAASDGLVRAIYPGEWARPGGARLSPNLAELRQARSELSASVNQILAMEARIIAHTEACLGGVQLETCGGLGDLIGDTRFQPGASRAEETPLSFNHGERAAVHVWEWFAAQIDHAFALLAEMLASLEALADDTPMPVVGRPAGSGIGISMTARGRLRHLMSVDAGIITNWRSTAPTDWNFNADGPVIHYLQSLDTDRVREAARWVIAALDPCAPCEVQVLEHAHA